MMEESRLAALYDLIMSEKITFETEDQGTKAEDDRTPEQIQADEDASLVTMTPGGVMLLPMEGTMMRGKSSFGGCSTVQMRRILRNGTTNPAVKAGLIVADTGGGSVAGTDELGQDIKAFGQVKPIHTHVSTIMASAGYWAGSQTSHISAARTAEIGSLGTYTSIVDSSKAAEDGGFKVIMVSTGIHKGAFTPGTEITPEQIAALKVIIEDLNEVFMEAVQDGRGFADKENKSLFDGNIHVAKKALNLGLIDSVSTLEEAVHLLEVQVSAGDAEADEAVAIAIANRNRLT